MEGEFIVLDPGQLAELAKKKTCQTDPVVGREGERNGLTYKTQDDQMTLCVQCQGILGGGDE